jgi:nucleoside-diphosphate-sugar epimerase
MLKKPIIIITGSSGYLATHIITGISSTFDFIGIDIKKSDNTKLLYNFENSSSNPCFLKYLTDFIKEKKLDIAGIIHCACPKILENDDRIENILSHFETATIPVMLLKDYPQIVIGTEYERLNNVLPYKLAKQAQELMCKEFNATYIKCMAFGNNTHLNHLVERFANINELTNEIKSIIKKW